jgi:hypothetical protein
MNNSYQTHITTQPSALAFIARQYAELEEAKAVGNHDAAARIQETITLFYKTDAVMG